jgi:hypothetical protein
MKRTILRSDNTQEETEVGDGYKSWNASIDARIGELVISPDGSIELWCDEEGLLCEEPELNLKASMLVGRQIVGDVIVFYPGDIK